MDARVCRSCGHLFNSIGGKGICPDCLKKQDEQLETVKGYISEHPTAEIGEITRVCGVSSSSIILDWARDGRLSFPEESPIRVFCEKCGAPIKLGRYCEKCRKIIISNLNKRPLWKK